MIVMVHAKKINSSFFNTALKLTLMVMIHVNFDFEFCIFVDILESNLTFKFKNSDSQQWKS